MEAKQKVYAYITWHENLLVFRHTEFPGAGIQVPGGTVEPVEDRSDAALREAVEETGLVELTNPQYVGEQTIDLNAYGSDQLHHRTFYHFTLQEKPADTWRTWEEHPSDGTQEPIEFEFYWMDLKGQIPTLNAEMDALLPELRERLGIG